MSKRKTIRVTIELDEELSIIANRERQNRYISTLSQYIRTLIAEDSVRKNQLTKNNDNQKDF